MKMLFVDKNGVELKPGMWVKSDGDKPSILAETTLDLVSGCNLGMDGTNYKYYENQHNRLIRETPNGERVFGKYVPRVEQVYPLTEFSLERNDDKFMLVDYEVCEKPEGAIMPQGVVIGQ